MLWTKMSRVAALGLRFVLAVVLLTAAVLKAHQLATEPVLAERLLSSRWLIWLTIQAELCCGLWLLLGPYTRAVRRAGVLLFLAFGVVALAKLLSGEATCGCFGRIHVNPLWTSMFDFSAAACLLACAPGESATSRSAKLRVLGVVGMWLLVGIPVGIVTVLGFTTESQAAGVNVAGNFVFLEPEKWLGKRLPILSEIESSRSLADGDWILLFYHRDCPACQDVLPAYARLGEASRRNSEGPRLALVELPPYADYAPLVEACEAARLSSEREWFMATPCEVRLRDGVVQRVTLEPAI